MLDKTNWTGVRSWIDLAHARRSHSRREFGPGESCDHVKIHTYMNEKIYIYLSVYVTQTVEGRREESERGGLEPPNSNVP